MANNSRDKIQNPGSMELNSNSDQGEKVHLRNEMKRIIATNLTELPPSKKASLCEKVALNIQSVLPEGVTVASFNPLKDEVNVNPYLDFRKYYLVYPKVIGEHLEFYYPSHEADFVKGEFGILEPDPERAEKIAAQDIEYMLIPGLAFDRKLMRLGRGRGFYDRYLENFRGVKVGICIKPQVINTYLPVETHDQPVDLVINEEFILQRIVA